MVLYVLFFLLLVMFLILLTDIKIIIILHRISEDDHIEIQISMIFGLIKYKFKIPYVDVFFNKMGMGIKAREEFDTKEGRELKRNKSRFSFRGMKALFKYIKSYSGRYIKVFKYTLSKIRMDYLRWHTKMGVSDAALTAVCVGIIWGIKTNIVSLLTSYIDSKDISIDVKPNYNVSVFETDFHCIIRIKIANIIIAGIRILYILIGSKIFDKGGDGSERASYSRSNEDYNG